MRSNIVDALLMRLAQQGALSATSPHEGVNMNAVDEIKRHAALAFFGSAYADAADEAHQPLRGRIMDQLPGETDPAAWSHANQLIEDVERANDDCAIEYLFADVQRLADGDRECTPGMFGHYLAMQSMGHGVGIADAFGSDAADRVTVPYVEFSLLSLEKSYF